LGGAVLGCNDAPSTPQDLAAGAPSDASVTDAAMPPPAPGGTFRTLGSQTLAQYLTGVRAALPEGENAADTRLLPVSGYLAFCGATLWRGKYSLGIAGGHGDSFDDGHYAQDLLTGSWETLLLPSASAGNTPCDVNGEWIANRPASQHSYFHLVTVGDDIVQGYGYAIGPTASGSKQAHRWNGAAGAWERYGTGGTSYPLPHAVHYDAARNRIVRFPLTSSAGTLDYIAANDATASWTTVPLSGWPSAFDIYGNIGFHPKLDCFVMSSQHDLPNRAWVLDAGNYGAGWSEVVVTGTAPTPMVSGGLEYVPTMQAFASANQEVADVLYFLAPMGTKSDGWRWTSQSFVGSTTPASWEQVGIQGKVKWSTQLGGLVLIKGVSALTEVFTPSAV
jgi:hypothetical protein